MAAMKVSSFSGIGQVLREGKRVREGVYCVTWGREGSRTRRSSSRSNDSGTAPRVVVPVPLPVDRELGRSARRNRPSLRGVADQTPGRRNTARDAEHPGRVGTERLAWGRFLDSPLRTRRATFTAPGSPEGGL